MAAVKRLKLTFWNLHKSRTVFFLGKGHFYFITIVIVKYVKKCWKFNQGAFFSMSRNNKLTFHKKLLKYTNPAFIILDHIMLITTCFDAFANYSSCNM